MDYHKILCGKEEYLPIYDDIVLCLKDISILPEMIEPIYRQAITLDDTNLEKFRFALLRLQLYSEINRNDDLEASQKMRFISEMIERTIFGGLFIERENITPD